MTPLESNGVSPSLWLIKSQFPSYHMEKPMHSSLAWHRHWHSAGPDTSFIVISILPLYILFWIKQSSGTNRKAVVSNMWKKWMLLYKHRGFTEYSRTQHFSCDQSSLPKQVADSSATISTVVSSEEHGTPPQRMELLSHSRYRICSPQEQDVMTGGPAVGAFGGSSPGPGEEWEGCAYPCDHSWYLQDSINRYPLGPVSWAQVRDY